MPSKTPAAEPGPPSIEPSCGRLPLMNRSMQEATNALREALVSAALEKNVDQVQPPIDSSTLRSGYRALSLRSWLKLPLSAWSGLSATPSTLSAALAGRW
jgi:hypothetical protein